jgi:SpoVK/Ycf46/Vps4 family AAA+-type ATPase
LESDFIQTAKLALAGGADGTRTFLRRMATKYPSTNPDFAKSLVEALRESPLRGASTGDHISKPIDGDSRLSLVREENPVILVNEPILPGEITTALQHVVLEYANVDRLLTAGLAPTRTVLFVGAPGVGKTLAARWLARELGLPLIVLDLASVMSSFLGRTGVNVKRVLDYARSTKAVLLLDELDAVAKRRDDSTEIGELKRLVTVLLQEIDTWPEGSLLVAASNHGELLDPAVWRRFELVLDFPLPDNDALAVGLREFLEGHEIPATLVVALARLYRGASLSELQRDVLRARRQSAMDDGGIVSALARVTTERLRRLPASERGKLAASVLKESDLTQREFNQLTGVSRDTLRKYLLPTTDEGKTDAQ